MKFLVFYSVFFTQVASQTAAGRNLSGHLVRGGAEASQAFPGGEGQDAQPPGHCPDTGREEALSYGRERRGVRGAGVRLPSAKRKQGRSLGAMGVQAGQE